jgi:murein DD-endopeptidase MepM/ murein hydrolase activator NlpD
MIAALGAFLGLLLLKLAFPGLAAGLREKLHIAQGTPQAIEVFRDLGKRLPLRETGAETPEKPEATTAPAYARKAFVSYSVEEGSPGGELPPLETPVPEAVAAFLERQTAFSDTLPENVDPSYLELPFDYASPVVGYESSGFGFRMHPILNTVRFHFGTDFAANAGEPVTAFADGVVSFAGSDNSYGNHIKIDHGGGWVSHYCHCSVLLVAEGQTVSQGERIALVGSTGMATGPHLHFELCCNGLYVNPEYYLSA